ERGGRSTMSPPPGLGSMGGGGAGGGGGGGRAGLGPGSARGGQRWGGERQTAGSRLHNLKGLLALLRPYRLRVVAMLFALVLGTAASLAPPLLAKLAIDNGIEQ